MRNLVFVHGRSQQNKDSVALKAEWVAALRKGLAKSGLELPVAEEHIRFPYYGDTLYGLSEGGDPSQVANIVVRGQGEGTAGQTRDAVVAYLDEVRTKLGISDDDVQAELERQDPADPLAKGAIFGQRGPQNWRWVRAILTAIDSKVPGGSGAAVALVTRDVFLYLSRPGIQQVLDDGVRGAMDTGVESVVVSHSLGTVVAYQMLRRNGSTLGWRVPLFVTLGSPLAITDIRTRLAPLRYPDCAAAWFNAMDSDDIVALYPLDDKHFPGMKPAIVNKTDVGNDTPNQHGISGYLSDVDVAKRIHTALTA